MDSILVICCFSEAEWKSHCDWGVAWIWSLYESRHRWRCGRVQNWREESHRHGGMWSSYYIC